MSFLQQMSSASLTQHLFLRDSSPDVTASRNMEIIQHAENRLLERRKTVANNMSSPVRGSGLLGRRSTEADIEEIVLSDNKEAKPIAGVHRINRVTSAPTPPDKPQSSVTKGPPWAGKEVGKVDKHNSGEKGGLKRLKFTGVVIAKKQHDKQTNVKSESLVIAKRQADKQSKSSKSDSKDISVVVDVDKPRPKIKLCKLTIDNVMKLEEAFNEKETRSLLLQRLLDDLLKFKQVKPDDLKDSDKHLREALGFRKRESLHEALGITSSYTDADDIYEEIHDDVDDRQEKLLRKLTQSLPAHLLSKTEDQTHNVIDVLGYTAYKSKLLENEKAITGKLGHKDARFQKLVHTLAK